MTQNLRLRVKRFQERAIQSESCTAWCADKLVGKANTRRLQGALFVEFERVEDMVRFQQRWLSELRHPRLRTSGTPDDLLRSGR
jgi:hypothetical protein